MARSSKHRQGLRLIDTLLRWSQITSRVCGCDLVALAGRRVLEIGCGPLGGFGPVALFLGARSFDAVDPELDPQIFAHPRVEDAYLGGLYADLVAVYGPRMERSAFIEAVRRDLHAHRAPLAEAKLADGPDVVLSISCLEHVFPLASVATVLEKLGGDRLTQLHLVDFSNHYPTKTPFEGLYSQPPNDYIASRGAAINLARPKDVAGVFRMHNMPFTVAMVRPGLM